MLYPQKNLSMKSFSITTRNMVTLTHQLKMEKKFFAKQSLQHLKKNVVAIEMERVFTGSTEYLKDMLIQAIESVKPVEAK